MIYLIGDLQGCCDAFERLLATLDFSPSRDRLYLLGDLVNRGPCSLKVLERLAGYAASSGRKVKDLLALVLTDVEMPEMDGYILTKRIKTDPRFDGVPVIMHSSLSGMSNQQLGRSVGVDEYVAKFEPQRLAEVLRRLITQHAVAIGAAGAA